MKKNLFFLSLAFTFASCLVDSPAPITQPVATNANISSKARAGVESDLDGSFELGARLVNPYALKNMKEALKVLQKENPAYKDKKIEATHSYVRIEATTLDAFTKVMALTDVELFRYPLDYQVTKSGSTYKEKDYTGKYQVFWAAVPVGYKFAKELKVSVIEELFLPFGTKIDNNAVNKTANDPFMASIDDKALTLYDPKYNGKNPKGRVAAGNRPYGVIKVYDDFADQFIPIEGVTIRGKRWFTSLTTKSSSIGFYQFDYEYNGPVDLTIIWEDPNFKITTDFSSPGLYKLAETTQNNITGAWSPNIVGVSSPLSPNYFSPEAYKYGNTWRAANIYYNKNTAWGIRKPPLAGSLAIVSFDPFNTLLTTKLVIGVRSSGTGGISYSHTWISPVVQGGAHIVLDFRTSSTYSPASNYTSLDMFSATIHELTHAQHFDLGLTRAGYLTNREASMMAETWAVAVEYKLTMETFNIKNTTKQHPFIQYSDREFDYKPLQSKTANYFNQWRSIGESAYTAALLDLIDNHNQFNYNSLSLNENVSNVPLSLMQSLIVINPTNWKALRDNIRFNYPQQTSEIKNIFDTYAKWDTNLSN